jgi:hypothetical protein
LRSRDDDGRVEIREVGEIRALDGND